MKTERLELAETDRLVIALNKLSRNGTNCIAWRRALYHAILMSNVADHTTEVKIREALGLP